MDLDFERFGLQNAGWSRDLIEFGVMSMDSWENLSRD